VATSQQGRRRKGEEGRREEREEMGSEKEPHQVFYFFTEASSRCRPEWLVGVVSMSANCTMGPNKDGLITWLQYH